MNHTQENNNTVYSYTQQGQCINNSLGKQRKRVGHTRNWKQEKFK